MNSFIQDLVSKGEHLESIRILLVGEWPELAGCVDPRWLKHMASKWIDPNPSRQWQDIRRYGGGYSWAAPGTYAHEGADSIIPRAPESNLGLLAASRPEPTYSLRSSYQF